MIRFQCPVCNTVISVPDTDAGRKSDCPRCGQRLQVPPASPPVRRQTMLGKLSRSLGRSRPRVHSDAPDTTTSPVPAGPPARLTEAIEHDGQTEPRRLRPVLLFCIGGLVIGLGLGTVATLMLSGGRGHGPANQQSRSTPENAAGPVVNAASKAARMSRQDFRQTVRSFKSINEGRQWDGINQDDGLTGLFFFSKDFHDAFGKPIKTETIGDRAYWYWQCADGVVQVMLHDKLGKMMRSYKDGTIKAFEEPGATKLNPGDVAALIAVNDGGAGAPTTSRPSGPPPPSPAPAPSAEPSRRTEKAESPPRPEQQAEKPTVEPPSPPKSPSETPQKEPLKPPAKAEEPAREDELPTDAELRRFAGQGKPVREVLSPDGRWTLSWSDVKTLLLWDARTGKELRRFRGHTVQGSGPAFSTDGSQVAAFSPDSKQVLSGGWDKTVRLWDAATGEQLRVFEGHTACVHCVAFSPDGKRVASAAGGFVQRDGRRVFVDCTVRLWDVESGRQLKTFEGHKEWVVCVAFSPDGRRLLSGSYDKTLRLWDVETGRQLRQFLGHTGAVQKVRFSPSGRYILSASGDRTARIWDAANGRELKRIDLTDAEGRAPTAPPGKGCRSVHLSYAGDEGTAFYNEVTMDKSAPGTYFMVCGWDRGYYGIQEQDKGVKILLFSVWDDSKQNNPDAVPADKRVKLVYRDRAVRVGRFGGEGTGGQSVFSYNWKTGKTYRFLVAAGAKDGRTEYAGYFYEPDRRQWRHLVTFSAPQSDGKLRGYYSFIEDFKQDGKSRALPRQAHFGNGWIKAKGAWAKLSQSRFTATNDPARNIGAGADPLFWLSTGGVVLEVSAAVNSDIRLRDEAKHALPDDLPVR